MSKQPEALRLADWLDAEACGGSNWNAKMNAAASELRRLAAVEAQRDALLAVLNKLEYSSDGYIKRYPEESEVNAAITKAQQ